MYSETNCPNNTLPITNPTQTAQESNPDLHSEKLLIASATAQPHSLAKPLSNSGYQTQYMFHC
jgi:hypothetical protein